MIFLMKVDLTKGTESPFADYSELLPRIPRSTCRMNNFWETSCCKIKHVFVRLETDGLTALTFTVRTDNDCI